MVWVVPVVKAIVGYDDGDWYEVLVEDCKAIITEAVFISRWAKVEGYHHLGERIVTDENYQRFAKGNKSSVQDLARKLGVSDRTLYYAMQFYDKYPRLDTLPDGKNISWNKIITQYLPSGDGHDQPAWVHRWDSMKGLAAMIADDPVAPDKIRKLCRLVREQ